MSCTAVVWGDKAWASSPAEIILVGEQAGAPRGPLASNANNGSDATGRIILQQYFVLLLVLYRKVEQTQRAASRAKTRINEPELQAVTSMIPRGCRCCKVLTRATYRVPGNRVVNPAAL